MNARTVARWCFAGANVLLLAAMGVALATPWLLAAAGMGAVGAGLACIHIGAAEIADHNDTQALARPVRYRHANRH